MRDITTSNLAKNLNGKLLGPDKTIKGIFTFLNQANHGDVVVRHWIDARGVEIAEKKGVSCVVTQNPRSNSIEIAEKLKIPLIIVPKIEVANAFALNWAIQKFAKSSIRVVVTGTNGKSTTAHMIFSILKNAGYNTYTNTDSKSEFNTLIDPVVSKQIAEFEENNNGKIEAMVIEVSEVQGWMDKLMKNHACLMTQAVDPTVLVLTNISLDHIGLVNSIEETYDEIYGSLKAISKSNNGTYVILNLDDPLLKKMGKIIEEQDHPKILYYGSESKETDNKELSLKSDGIHYGDALFLKTDSLPFKSTHFIQNTMAAIGASITLNIDFDLIKNAVSSYKPLERRFTILGKDPLIIDDFAHNPKGIIATIKSTAKMSKGMLYVVFAIRGSRGESINHLNTKAVVNGLKDIDHKVVVTSSNEVVDDLNTVKSIEKDIVLKTLNENGFDYIFKKNLYDALEYTVDLSDKNSTILLIGAQGMDPASQVLKKLNKI
jgi:UDP-N-acetylmuramoyl-L-alanyl-D-glutamate--2,6-diaminopimelate ligase